MTIGDKLQLLHFIGAVLLGAATVTGLAAIILRGALTVIATGILVFLAVWFLTVVTNVG